MNVSRDLSSVSPGSPPPGIIETTCSLVTPSATVPFQNFLLEWFALRIICSVMQISSCYSPV